ncbi:hypothetical protein BFJ71_g6600 [Fusarium oxysporum]|nr:hypothetical protein BFJ67_g2428 [Fusarium oxysporum f. sp. cepae]RKK98591.1 hypothetical protein BFJ71_g6600 [Fusarium oxysporum]
MPPDQSQDGHMSKPNTAVYSDSRQTFYQP